MSYIQDIKNEFEAWVKETKGVNFLALVDEPGYENDYAHPWTRGAWEAWQRYSVKSATMAALRKNSTL